MHFYKLFAGGQDYIFCDDENKFNNLAEEEIKRICDRVCGVGGTGIFTIYQNGTENTQIRAFDENGEIIHDSSTTAICGALGAKITKGVAVAEFVCENNRYFTYLSRVERGKYLVSCDIGKCRLLLKDGSVKRKTELGNRILTLTAVGTTADYAVHFSECMHSLKWEYLSEKTASLSLFGGKTSLVLCEENDKNSFSMLPLYKNGRNMTHFGGAFAAVGVAACLCGRSEFSREIFVDCDGYGAYVVVEKNLSVTVHLNASIAYEGNI